jgi:hypothetical protein
VEVGSDGGSGSHCMKARVEMLGGEGAGWSGRSMEARMVCIFLERYTVVRLRTVSNLNDL